MPGPGRPIPFSPSGGAGGSGGASPRAGGSHTRGQFFPPGPGSTRTTVPKLAPRGSGGGSGSGSGSSGGGLSAAQLAAFDAAVAMIKANPEMLEAYMRLFNANTPAIRNALHTKNADLLLATVQAEVERWRALNQPSTTETIPDQSYVETEEIPPYINDPSSQNPPAQYQPPATTTPPATNQNTDQESDKELPVVADADKSAATDAVDQKSFFETYKTPIYVVAGAAGLYFLAKYAKSQGWIK